MYRQPNRDDPRGMYGYPRFSRGRTQRQRQKSPHFQLSMWMTPDEFEQFLHYLDSDFMPCVLTWSKDRRRGASQYECVLTCSELSSVSEIERHLRDIQVRAIFGNRQLTYYLNRCYEDAGGIQEIRFSGGPSPEFLIAYDHDEIDTFADPRS